MPERHFVKYTFLKLDPQWRRLDSAQRAEDKREFIAACEDFGTDHLLRAFSTVGTRGDVDLLREDLITHATSAFEALKENVARLPDGVLDATGARLFRLRFVDPSAVFFAMGITEIFELA